MNYAAESDMENNKAGRPGTAKMRVADKVITKLKSTRFAQQFLQDGGLDVLSKFMTKLPDGSWPLSSVRHSILKLIHTLPVTVEQIRSSQLGRTLGMLQVSPKEFGENKKLIQAIKDKWSRVLCDIEVEYARLEQCERTLGLPLTLRAEDETLGKRREEEEEAQNNLSYGMSRPNRMGYSFSVRPASVYDSRTAERGRSEQQAEFDKYLMRIRRSTKRA